MIVLTQPENNRSVTCMHSGCEQLADEETAKFILSSVLEKQKTSVKIPFRETCVKIPFRETCA